MKFAQVGMSYIQGEQRDKERMTMMELELVEDVLRIKGLLQVDLKVLTLQNTS